MTLNDRPNFFAKCKMQNAKCKMQNAKCKMQNAKCKMQNAKCKMQNFFNPKSDNGFKRTEYLVICLECMDEFYGFGCYRIILVYVGLIENVIGCVHSLVHKI